MGFATDLTGLEMNASEKMTDIEKIATGDGAIVAFAVAAGSKMNLSS